MIKFFFSAASFGNGRLLRSPRNAGQEQLLIGQASKERLAYVCVRASLSKLSEGDFLRWREEISSGRKEAIQL
jgi:hypothetical protein